MPWTRLAPEREEILSPGQAGAGSKRLLDYAAAVREALDQALAADPRVFVMGQGVDDPKGMFGATKGLHEKYGRDRVFDTPLAEGSLMGVAVGAALGGMRPVYFHNRPDFLFLACDQLINHASKWNYMFGGAVSVPLVVWACVGRGWGSAAQHSQALHGLFMHVPGLKLVTPSSCADAKGLMLAAIADPNPVLILEHRWNFRYRGHVPEEMYRIPLGKGVVRRRGKDITIVGISHSAVEALQAAQNLQEEGIEAEVIDPRTLRPLDKDLILESVSKTRRLLIADTGWRTCGAAAEIAAVVAEELAPKLRAPIKRVTPPDAPTPAGYTLEEAFYPGTEDIEAQARSLVRWEG